MIARQQTALVNGNRIVYTMRRSRKAHRVAVHVDAGGAVEVVVPARTSLAEAERFFHNQQAWVARHLQQRRPRGYLTFADGSRLPWRGRHIILYVMREERRRRAAAVFAENALWVTVAPHQSVRKVVERWYRRQAYAYFHRAAHEVAQDLRVVVRRVAIGNHRTQWGSCGTRGRLSFNWRLLIAPSWIAEYVVAHEVAHLVHHNHSRAYWRLVEHIFPRTPAARRWLRENADLLQW